MSLRVSLTMFGEKAFDRTLLGIETRSRDLRGAFQLIRREFHKIEKDQFRSQGATGSGGWAPLKPETIRRKAARGTNRGILRAENDLMKSLTTMSHPNSHYEATRNTMRLWTSDPKAGIHQKGAPSVNLPQRRVVDLTEANRNEFAKILQRWVMERDAR